MGITSTKMRNEITALKAEIITMERRQAYLVKAAVKQAEVRLSIERERAVREERSRVDQLEELRSVAELENELLKEMVAAEQVNVKLQQKRNQALKWELLRQGGTQEKFDSIVKEVPDLGDTLRADTAHVVHEATTYGMSEAIEHVVSALGDVEEEMRQAFLARDKGRTGALPGSNFKDALRECLPNMPRAERCLLALRFARDEDQSIDYSEFLGFCRRKAQTRERQKLGLVEALAASRSVEPLGVASLGGNRALAATRASKGMTEEQKLSKNPSAYVRGIPRPEENSREQERGCPEVFKQGFGHQALQAKRKRVDQKFDVLVARKMTDMIHKRGKDLELMLKRADPAGAGVIPVKQFSECLRSLNVVEVAEGNRRKKKLLLTRSDRKDLYRMWAVHGQVHYNDFLRAGGYANSPPLRYSQSFTTDRRPSLARHNTSPPLPRSADAQGVDELSAPRLQGLKTDKLKAQAAWAEPRLEEADEELLPARNEVVLAHLAQVLEKKGEETLFEEFEERDADGCRTVDEYDLMDAMAAFAPEVTTEQALDLFRARSNEAEGSIAYDKFFKELRKRARAGVFQSGDDVQFRVEDREGRLHWVDGQVVSRDEEDSTYTVRFKSRVPGRGYVEEYGVIEGHLRVGLRQKTPLKKTKTTVVAELKVKAASWWTDLSKRLSRAKETGAVLVSVQLKRLLGSNRDSAKKPATRARADENVDSSETHDHRRSRHRRSTGPADSEASDEVSSSSRGSSASTSNTEQRPDGFEPHQQEGLLEGDISPALPSAHSPSAASHTKKRRGSSNGSDGSDGGRGSGRVGGSGGTEKRRTVELPEVQKVSSPPQGKLQDSSHGYHRKKPSPSVLHRKDPAVDHFSGSGRRGTSRNATLRHGRDQRRSSGGLKSLEALGDERIENKFDLYKKRTKAALSPEKRS